MKNAEVKNKVWDFLGSYGFACILLLLLFVLTLLGTLEQTTHGLYEVQKKYFESLFLVHHLGGVLPIPLPGVYLVLILLAINLVVGGLIRIRKSSQTVGVIVIHVGIVILLLAGFVKLKFSDDGHLTLFENQKSDEYQSYFEWEVAIYDATQSSKVRELIIPEEQFSDLEGGKTRAFTHPDLPIRITFSNFVRNGQVLPKGPKWSTPHPVVDGYAVLPQALAKEAEQNVAAVYVKVEDKQGGVPKDGILWGWQRLPLVYASNGKSWAIDFRKKRFKMPFTIHLDKFTRELHPRTGIAKVFMSDVTKSENGVDQKLKIEMNQPLRHGGLVLFQASWGPENAKPGEPLFSTFAVVRNPSDQWPLIACIVIAGGMLIAFTQKLVKYVRAQQGERKAA